MRWHKSSHPFIETEQEKSMITNMIKEYESLRNEILQKIQLTNTLLNDIVNNGLHF